MGRLPITLQDIATRTGVSKVTVSYVLNGRETRVRISDGTRQRVLEAAREMGYTPNAVARALARRRTDTITLVMQSPTVFSGGSGFISELMHGVLDEANALGYDLLLHTKNLPGVEEEIRALTDGRADGLLLLRDLDDPLTHELHARQFPCVSLFARQPDIDAFYVDCDNAQGAGLAVEYLHGLGHRRIGFIGGNPASAAVRDRREGFLQAHHLLNLPHRAEWDCMITFHKGDFGPLLHLMRQDNAPTAFLVWSDEVALGVIRALRELGLQVPNDVSVVGFDGTEAVCERSVPRLTSIEQPIYDIAARAVRLLARRIGHPSCLADEGGETGQTLLPPQLAVRDSCAPPQGQTSLSDSAAQPAPSSLERKQ